VNQNFEEEISMEPLWNWGNEIIIAIQTIHNPALDGFFNAVTFMGEAEFYLLIFPLIMWAFNKSIGQRAVFLVFLGLTVNAWVKDAFGHPRPFEWPSVATSPVLKLNETARGPGLPSGHTQASLILWYYLAYHFKKQWLWILATILFVFVSFSRIYLGVHFPTDVLGGVILGLIMLLLFIKFEDRLVSNLRAQSVWLQVGLAIIIPLVLIVIYPQHDTVAALSALSGFSLGIILDRRIIHFDVTGSVTQKILRYVVGIIMLAVIYVGIEIFQPDPGQSSYIPIRMIRYMVAGFWVSGGAPWFFTKIKLA
jgi:membrane-associated phospholipid phosphatase